MDTENAPKKHSTFFWLAAAGFLVLRFLPDVLTWLSLPAGQVFNGSFVNLDDTGVYLSAIRQGAEGAWLFTPQYSPEGLPAHLSYLPFLLAGRCQSLLGGSGLLWLTILNIFSTIFALFALAKLIQQIFPDRANLQKTSFLILLFSGGGGWIILLLAGSASRLTPDLFVPEWNLITSAFSSPHFLLGIGLQALFISIFNQFLAIRNWKQTGFLALTGILLGLTYPFLIMVDGLLLAAYTLLKIIQDRAVPWRLLGQTAAASLPMVAFLAYYGLILPRDQVWRLTMIVNNQILPPPLPGVAVGLGLLLVLMLPALKPMIQNPKLLVFPLWFGANLIALYLPFSFSGRFLLGMFIPAGIIAAYGLEEIILPRLPKASSKNVILGLTFPSTLLFVLWSFLGAQAAPGYPYFYRQSEVRAAQWLGERTTTEDLILADYPAGSLIPRHADGLVFAGHLNLTIALEDKLDLVHTFFDPSTPQTWRDQLIDEWGVTYIYQGHFENAISGGEPLPLPYPIVYDSDGIIIYALP